MALSKTAIYAIVVVVIVIVAACAVVAFTGGDDEDESGPVETYVSSDGILNGPTTDSKGRVVVETFFTYSNDYYKVVFDSTPTRIVPGCSTALNMLLYLGLGDYIIGAFYNEEDVWDEVADEYAKVVTRIGEVGSENNLYGNISSDVLLSWEPDLVIGWASSTANVERLQLYVDSGLHFMTFNTMSTAGYADLDMMKVDLDNLGAIFGITDKTNALWSEIQSTVSTVTSALKGVGTIYYCMADGEVGYFEDGTVWMYGNDNFLANVLNGMGLSNAFPDGGNVSLAGIYEVIGTTNIDVIMFIEYGDVSMEKSIQSWYSDPDLAGCKSIEEDNSIGVKLSISYGSSPELIDVLQSLADYVLTL